MGASLTRAGLGRADLRGANLFLADLTGAVLVGANLTGADLKDARLYGANLSGAVGLVQTQLDAARGDASTRLPAGLARPAHWPQPEETGESDAR